MAVHCCFWSHAYCCCCCIPIICGFSSSVMSFSGCCNQRIDRPINKPNQTANNSKKTSFATAESLVVTGQQPELGILTSIRMFSHMHLNTLQTRWTELEANIAVTNDFEYDLWTYDWISAYLPRLSVCMYVCMCMSARVCARGCLLGKRSTSLNFNFIVYLMVAASIMSRWFLLI